VIYILVLGCCISVVALLVCWIPYIGIYGLTGLIGILLCGIVLYKKAFQNVALFGITTGLIACVMGLYWWQSLKRSGGHLF